MDISLVLKSIIEIGITPVLLILFVKYFFEQDNKRAKSLESRSKERESILIAESTRREEILRAESNKREEIIKHESERREMQLLKTIEDFNLIFEKYGRTMQEISKTMDIMQSRNIEMSEKIEVIEKAVMS